ncbi:hypothetical protein [Amycolatopsis sp. ATCC 39116]|uniref:hypothetical protein n=1 Tax=Amycolatopsis sp. (strain ATCC 39116 / 75iv2) TaxID=385957 RepID=UPI000262569F|nr:hypothetical protein [Amycolatopsis sp. ATCC 39116]
MLPEPAEDPPAEPAEELPDGEPAEALPEPAAEPLDEPADEPAEEPLAEPAEEPPAELPAEPAEELPPEPADEPPADEPPDDEPPADEPPDDELPADEPAEEPPADEPPDEPADEPPADEPPEVPPVEPPPAWLGAPPTGAPPTGAAGAAVDAAGAWPPWCAEPPSEVDRGGSAAVAGRSATTADWPLTRSFAIAFDTDPDELPDEAIAGSRAAGADDEPLESERDEPPESERDEPPESEDDDEPPESDEPESTGEPSTLMLPARTSALKLLISLIWSLAPPVARSTAPADAPIARSCIFRLPRSPVSAACPTVVATPSTAPRTPSRTARSAICPATLSCSPLVAPFGIACPAAPATPPATPLASAPAVLSKSQLLRSPLAICSAWMPPSSARFIATFIAISLASRFSNCIATLRKPSCSIFCTSCRKTICTVIRVAICAGTMPAVDPPNVTTAAAIIAAIWIARMISDAMIMYFVYSTSSAVAFADCASASHALVRFVK